MNADALHARLLAIAAMEGVIGCAVVDVDTGMAWNAAGGEDIQIVCEAASDFWRLALRQSAHFGTSVGDLAAQVLIHARGRITLVRVIDSLLLVCVTREPDQVDWARWKTLVGCLRVVATAP